MARIGNSEQCDAILRIGIIPTEVGFENDELRCTRPKLHTGRHRATVRSMHASVRWCDERVDVEKPRETRPEGR
jgi:hypothetical protein